MNGGNGEIPLEERQTGTLAKAPSYVNIKQTLIKEFGEEAFARSKKEVQTRMAAIAQEVEPWYEQPKELTKQEIIMEQMEAHAAVASEKMKQAGEVASEKMKQAGKWLSGMRKECEEAAGDLSNAIAGSNSGDGGIAPKTAEELAEEKKATERTALQGSSIAATVPTKWQKRSLAGTRPTCSSIRQSKAETLSLQPQARLVWHRTEPMASTTSAASRSPP